MKLQIVLNLSSTSDVQATVDADTYCNSISASNNSNFVAPQVSAPVAALISTQIATTRSSITGLKNAIAAPNSDTKNDGIRSARAVLDSNLGILANLVENVANASTVLDINREGIVHSAGMQIKVVTKRKKQQFMAKSAQDKSPGAIFLVAQGKANAHLWAYTTDLVALAPLIQAEPTTVANTTIYDLQIGKKYAMFHKPITPKGPHPWEGPEFITVT